MAWIDCLARGATLGRSLVTRGDFMARDSLPARLSHEPLRPAPAGRLTVPADAPSVLLNQPRSVSSTPSTYRLGRTRGGVRPVHFDPFFFPLDRIGAWNRLYGRSGFVQYQCMLPEAVSTAGITVLLERVAAAGRGSFLAVLKLLGSGGEGLLSFSMEGYTLALDFPMRPGTLALLDDLDEITVAEASIALAECQHFHNHVRPHQALDWKTPAEYLQTIKDCPSQSHIP